MTGIIPTLEQADELHRAIAPSPAAYDLIHTHCVIIATITRQLVHRQNALFIRRCTLPAGAAELGGRTPAVLPSDAVVGGTVPPYLLDEKLAVLGAMLHDIGTYQVLKSDGADGQPLCFDGPRYILHGLLGYKYLLAQGVDESVAQFARNHTGVGLTHEQVKAQQLPLPEGDYVPLTLEQEVVMVADKYHSKSIPPKFLSAEAYAAKAARYGEANRRQWLELVAKYGTPDIPALAQRFGMRLKER
ncbi:MAG: HD domain-containing protein [Bifidobacterium sp.]|jgi:uncharacterized protein|nr:HD domain-containing protein [Bifidobacterium sp.]